MKIGVIADDFTGASDIASTLVAVGLKTVQFLGVPQGDVADCEAGVVALKSRSIPAAEAVAQSLEALDFLLSKGARQIIFKVCSTFDSTPEGNIGPVALALAERLGAGVVPVCPAFPTNKRTVYMGHLFVGDRLLSDSGMQNHPLNPMTDADLVRWLGRQVPETVGLVALPDVRGGAGRLAAALEENRVAGHRLVIVDAVDDADLLVLADATRSVKLLVGGSAIALGRGHAASEQGVWPGTDGPGVVLSGSCSSATLAQVERYAALAPSLAVSVAKVMEGTLASHDLVDFALAHREEGPLIYSSSPPAEVEALQVRFGRENVAERLDALFGGVARALVDAGFRRVVVAGGETSGAVVSALACTSLRVGPPIDSGVPALLHDGEAPIALALKSGNFGSLDFFAKALGTLAGQYA